MLPDPTDTIVALSSVSGPGARAIVRLTGRRVFAISRALAIGAWPESQGERYVRPVQLLLKDIERILPADMYCWKGPRTYTGDDLVEIHTLASPPMIDILMAQCLDLGARAAQAGEFTMRAFLAGKLDLTQVEA